MKVLLGIVLLLNFIRFFDLEKTPPGFFSDEALAATHEICLAQTGHDGWGHSWPLFTQTVDVSSGFNSPFHMYGAALWTKIFGISIKAFRSFSSFVAVVAVLGLFFLGRLLGGLEAGLFFALAGTLSPPLIQFSRIACDDPLLMAAGLVWGIYFWFRSSKKDLGWSALCFTIALYSYPPFRLQFPFVLGILIWQRFKLVKRAKEGLLFFGGVLTVLCLPVIVMTLQGRFLARTEVVTLFSPGHFAALHIRHSWEAFPVIFKNFLLHLDPKFLFVSGDGNLRHSTQGSGELSWLDAVALMLGLFFVSKGFLTKKDKGLLVFIGVGALAGLLPAALGFGDLPHALHAFGAWPFVAMGTGWMLAHFQKKWNHAWILVLVIALLFAVNLGYRYETRYLVEAPSWFDSAIKDQAQHIHSKKDLPLFIAATRGYPSLAVRYYLMSYSGEDCESSARLLK